MKPEKIRAVFFDAVGTILHPVPGVAEAYWTVGKRFGSDLSLAEVQSRVKSAFARQERDFSRDDHRTCESREEVRWRGVVAECLPDVGDPEGCFRELHRHFGDPLSWQISPGLETVLEKLDHAGLILGVASNFDERLRRVSSGFSCLGRVRHWVISAEVGWRKPSPRFYQHLVKVVGVPASSILLVGDDPLNDLEAPRNAGMHGLLVQGDGCLAAMAERFGQKDTVGV